MKQKDYKLMILGIAIMLLGLYCSQLTNLNFLGGFMAFVAILAPIIGFIIVVIGYIFIDV